MTEHSRQRAPRATDERDAGPTTAASHADPLADATLADRSHAWLDEVPRRLLEPAVTNLHGALGPRVQAVTALRGALLSGALPDAGALAWPDAPLRAALLDALARGRLAKYCDGDPELTDAVLLSVLEATDDAERLYLRMLASLHETARAEALMRGAWRLHLGVGDDLACGGDGTLVTVMLSEADWEQVRRDALRVALEAARGRVDVSMQDAWAGRVREWRDIELLLAELRAALRLRGDRMRGALRALRWSDTLRVRRMMAALPALAELLRVLGRLHESDAPDAPSVLEQVVGPIRRVIERPREHRDPVVRVETVGVDRSDEIARMLPSEAALLLQPTLRRLWHARRAERALLTYEAEGVATRRTLTEQGFGDGATHVQRRPERGPVIVVLDTSGSMCGAPESLAKAVVLQAMCVAHEEERPCYVYNFSGPGEIAEHELSLAPEGLAEALGFLTLSFHGGTCIDEALRRALARQRERAWRYADIVVVTDGEFAELPRETVAQVRAARARGTVRVHGVLVGYGEGDWLRALCDPVHVLTEWLARVRPKG